MEITGKMKKILPEVTGEGKNGTWRKQNFVIETMDEYPKSVCISTWGDKINLSLYKENEPIKVSINIESREYNDKWYTDVKAWKVEKLGQGEAGGQAPVMEEVPDFGAPPPGEDDLPF